MLWTLNQQNVKMSGGLITEVQPDLVVKDDVSSHGLSPPLHCDGWTPLDGDLDTRGHGDGKIVKLRKTNFWKQKSYIIQNHSSFTIIHVLSLAFSYNIPTYSHNTSTCQFCPFKETLSAQICCIDSHSLLQHQSSRPSVLIGKVPAAPWKSCALASMIRGSAEQSTSLPQINSSTCDSPPPGTLRRPAK